MKGILLRRLIFTGPKTGSAGLEFVDGLNVVFGSSNTGKSFASKAILFMLGAIKKLPETEQMAPFTAIWLALTLRGGRDLTLYRAKEGGAVVAYNGFVGPAALILGELWKGDLPRREKANAGKILLSAMGFAEKKIATDSDGTKERLTLGTLSPYFVVSEGRIMDEDSPVFASKDGGRRIVQQNLLKLILTGQDDASLVQTKKLSLRVEAKAAKIELIDELIAQIDSKLTAAADESTVKLDLANIDREAVEASEKLKAAQHRLDHLVIERRREFERRRTAVEKQAELELTLRRFARLQSVYRSDLQRLKSIEEGGYLLVALAGMECPVCGAPPEAQKHSHATEEIDIAYQAAAAEARKIQREQVELEQAIASLSLDSAVLSTEVAGCDAAIALLDTEREAALPLEASLRSSYEDYTLRRERLAEAADRYLRRAELTARRAVVDGEITERRVVATRFGPTNIDAFKLGESIKRVLVAWHFPNAENVDFDPITNDLKLAGKSRSANGKGVRAVLHAAFSVAVILHCIDNNLAHPGFLTLDTPLLTYRGPKTRHGALTADERSLQESTLAKHFYEHLASLSEHIQVIVIENTSPPSGLDAAANIVEFTANDELGRYGLLPSVVADTDAQSEPFMG